MSSASTLDTDQSTDLQLGFEPTTYHISYWYYIAIHGNIVNMTISEMFKFIMVEINLPYEHICNMGAGF